MRCKLHPQIRVKIETLTEVAVCLFIGKLDSHYWHISNDGSLSGSCSLPCWVIFLVHVLFLISVHDNVDRFHCVTSRNVQQRRESHARRICINQRLATQKQGRDLGVTTAAVGFAQRIHAAANHPKLASAPQWLSSFGVCKVFWKSYSINRAVLAHGSNRVYCGLPRRPARH
jgi:hypothetical protein